MQKMIGVYGLLLIFVVASVPAASAGYDDIVFDNAFLGLDVVDCAAGDACDTGDCSGVFRAAGCAADTTLLIGNIVLWGDQDGGDL